MDLDFFHKIEMNKPAPVYDEIMESIYVSETQSMYDEHE
jgi:hypothetical protein